MRDLEALLAEKELELEEYRAREMRLSRQISLLSGEEDLRLEQRFPIDWRAHILCDSFAGQQIFHGRAHDISFGGVSIFCAHNVFFTEDVIVVLAVPPFKFGAKERLIEVRSRFIYTVLAASGFHFRTGIKFLEFKNDGRKVLEEYMSHHYSFL